MGPAGCFVNDGGTHRIGNSEVKYLADTGLHSKVSTVLSTVISSDPIHFNNGICRTGAHVLPSTPGGGGGGVKMVKSTDPIYGFGRAGAQFLHQPRGRG